jgi:hypothetical protein
MVPEPFQQTHVIDVALPSGRSIALPHCRASFPGWVGSKPAFAFGGKAFLDSNGTPVFAEILILHRLRAAGWDGVWVSSFGGFKFLTRMPTDVSMAGATTDLAPDKERLLRDIRERSGCRGGCFDVFAWREDETLFCEAKRLGHDQLRDTQRRWMDAALTCGVPLSRLLVIEWSLSAVG